MFDNCVLDPFGNYFLKVSIGKGNYFLIYNKYFLIVFSNEKYLEYFWNIFPLFETVAYSCKYGWKLFIFSWSLILIFLDNIKIFQFLSLYKLCIILRVLLFKYLLFWVFKQFIFIVKVFNSYRLHCKNSFWVIKSFLLYEIFKSSISFLLSLSAKA